MKVSLSVLRQFHWDRDSFLIREWVVRKCPREVHLHVHIIGAIQIRAKSELHFAIPSLDTFIHLKESFLYQSESWLTQGIPRAA